MTKQELIKRATSETYELLIDEVTNLVEQHVEEYYYGYAFLDYSKEVFDGLDKYYDKGKDLSPLCEILPPVIANISTAVKKSLEELSEKEKV